MLARRLLPLIGLLYIGQYLGIGFLHFGLAGILREHGIDLRKLAAIGLIGAIWAVKALWSPLIDRYTPFGNGHYRAWLLLLQPLVILTTLALLPFTKPHETLVMVLVVIALYVTAAATQDIATDAVVARYVPPELQGWANGLAVIGSWLGGVIGGGLVLIVYDHYGWTAAIITLAVFTAIPVPFVWAFKEPAAQTDVNLAQRYRELGKLFRFTHQRRWMTYAMPAFWAAGVAGYAVITPALVDANWSLTKIGVSIGIAMSIPAACGALLSGWAYRKFGLQKLTVASGLAVAAASVALAATITTNTDSVKLIGIGCYIAAMTALSTSVYSTHMAFARFDYAGSDFTMLTCIGTLWTQVGGFISLTLAHYIGYSGTALVFAVIVGLGGFIAARVIYNADLAGTLRLAHSAENSAPKTPVTP